VLHKTSYWSSSSVVIVLLHKALCYSNFEILWNLMKFLKVLKFYENFEFKKKNEILRNFWNFEFFFFILNFKFIFLQFYNFEIFLKFWNFLKFSNILISKKQNNMKYGIVRNTLFLYNCKSTKCNIFCSIIFLAYVQYGCIPWLPTFIITGTYKKGKHMD
jgi:hypothetical protein